MASTHDTGNSMGRVPPSPQKWYLANPLDMGWVILGHTSSCGHVIIIENISYICKSYGWIVSIFSKPVLHTIDEFIGGQILRGGGGGGGGGQI